jgi:hypothetical protein
MPESIVRLLKSVMGFIILSFALVGCLFGGDAGDAAKERFVATSKGEYAKAWESLHDDQQAIVSKEKFVECGEEGEAGRAPEIEDVKVLDENVEEKEIAEVGVVESHVIELEWRQGEDVRRGFFDMIDVDGDWKWVLGEDAIEAFRTGECPR